MMIERLTKFVQGEPGLMGKGGPGSGPHPGEGKKEGESQASGGGDKKAGMSKKEMLTKLKALVSEYVDEVHENEDDPRALSAEDRIKDFATYLSEL